MRISGEYQKLNSELHEGAGWGKGGTKFFTPITNLAHSLGVEDILDYGCGKGRLVNLLHNASYNAEGYDPCFEKYAADPFPAQLLVSTDMLEHVEPEYLHNVLTHMASLAEEAAFLVVSLVPAVKHLPDGRNAHLIVKRGSWWGRELDVYFPGIVCTSLRTTTAEFTWQRV